MNSDVKVSIITPLYNSERYIDDFVSKIFEQTLDGFELIFVDDASPDNSFDKAKHYGDLYPEKISAYHYDKNRGAGGARNFGLNRAIGEFVCFVDPDDWMDATMLEKLYTVAVRDCCDIVDCDYFDYIENKKTLIKKTSLCTDCIGIVSEQMLNRLAFDSGRVFTKIFKRCMLIDNLLYYPENIRFEDNGVNLCICAKKVGKVKECLFYYRTNSNTSQTGALYRKDYVLDRVKASEHLVKQFIRLNKFEAAFSGLEYRFINIGYASNIYIYIVSEFAVNYQVLEYAKELVDKYFRNFKDNVYYKRYISFAYRASILLYELNPKLVGTFKTFRPLIKFAQKIVRFFKGCD